MSERDEREMIEKNMSLSIEFSKYIFEHPEFDDKIPKGAQVVLLPEYDEDLSAYNLRIAEGQREKGQPVVYVRKGTTCSLREDRTIISSEAVEGF